MSEIVVESTTSYDGTGYSILHLPHEVLLKIILYLEIPNVAAILQTSKPQNGSLAHIVATWEESIIWLRLVNLRFNLQKNLSSRPTSCGGPTWKEVYRTLSLRRRIPKVRLPFKQKGIFATGSAYFEGNTFKEEDEKNKNHKIVSHEKCEDTRRTQHNITMCTHTSKRKARRYHYLSCWVMVNHTEDCNVRQLTTYDIRSIESNPTTRQNVMLRPVGNNPYIELQVAYQNTKSTYGTVLIDVLNASVQMIVQNGEDNEENYTIHSQKVIQDGTLKPRIIYRSIGSKVYYQDNAKRYRRPTQTSLSSSNHVEEDEILYHYSRNKKIKSMPHLTSSPIELGPFEFVIVSVNVPLAAFVDRRRDFQFETDFLSNAITIMTPARFQSEHIASHQVSSHPFKSICLARFIKEHEVWENYTQLPGNYLSLANVNRFGRL